MSEKTSKSTPRLVKLLVIMTGLFIGQMISRFTFEGFSLETLRGFFSLYHLLGAIIFAFVLGFIILIIIEKMEKRKRT